MTRESQDPWWDELRTRARRTYPRYDPALYGVCRACAFGPTQLDDIVGVVWARCAACNTRWPVGANVFDTTEEPDWPAFDHDTDLAVTEWREDLTYAAMLELADAIELHPEESMTTTTPHNAIRLIDPWPDVNTFQSCKDAGAPRLWYFLTTDARRRIGGVAILIARYPARTFPGAPDVLLRATHETTFGFGRKTDALLRPYYVADSEEREAWRRAAGELRDPRLSSLLSEAVRILHTATAKATQATAVRDALLGHR